MKPKDTAQDTSDNLHEENQKLRNEMQVLVLKLAAAERERDEAKKDRSLYLQHAGESQKVARELESSLSDLRRQLEAAREALFGYRREHDSDTHSDDGVCGCDLCRDATAALTPPPSAEEEKEEGK